MKILHMFVQNYQYLDNSLSATSLANEEEYPYYPSTSHARLYWSPHLHDDTVRDVPVLGLTADGQPVEVELRGGHGERELGVARGGELRPADVELVPAGREAELGGARDAGHRQARVEGVALQPPVGGEADRHVADGGVLPLALGCHTLHILPRCLLTSPDSPEPAPVPRRQH